ncbi:MULTISPECIES: response regulator transcription factor [Priestia]|uniref:response regulator transcription factor n=1 Tax=Priestia TaxID=2800373 RepID=UPI00203E4475|nr:MULTISPECIES: response regulator transcription factor [Priestia]MCM3773194.1 response regulator transcription factor [Priestia aryabhattai]MDY0942093.1 response regulator transcription factor [Priestia megaterium]
MKEKILIVEDEAQIAKVLKIELEFEDYEVDVEYDGKAGLEAAISTPYDLVLLDVMLPSLSGIEVLRRLRKAEVFTPVILLTARNTTLDKVMGLDQGANDYVTKPFEIEELLARVRSCIRYRSLVGASGTKEAEAERLTISDLTINLETREVLRNNESITLTPKEYDLVVYLLTNKNKIVTREGILTNVWGYEYEGETNVIDVYIRHLRKKIDEGFSTSLIHTVRGVGYMMKEENHEDHDED